MTPRSFDIDTCKEIIGDAGTRVIEANAREDAESCKFNLINIPDQVSYWEKIRLQMQRVIYATAHLKRLERIKRMKQRELEVWAQEIVKKSKQGDKHEL